MSLTTRALHPLFGAEMVGLDVTRADDATFARDRRRLRGALGAALPRAVPLRRGADRVQPALRPARDHHPQHRESGRAPRPRSPTSSNVDGEDRLIPTRRQAQPLQRGQPDVAHRQLVQEGARARVAALRPRDPARGRRDPVREHAGGLRRGCPPTCSAFLEGKVAVHSFVYSRGLVDDGLMPPDHAAQVPPVRQALVRANPVNGRKAFYVGSHACEIVGMPTAEARALLRELLERPPGPELVYTHRWRVGDLVMWDNRCMLHRGRPWDESRYRRVMHRTTVAGEGPTAPDEAAGRVSAPRARKTWPGAALSSSWSSLPRCTPRRRGRARRRRPRWS